MSLHGKARKILLLLLVLIGLLVGHPGLAGTIQGQVRSNTPTKDLSNFVISVEDIEGPFPAPREPAIMDQKGLHFVPHVLVVQVGTLVEFPNSDPVSHNVFSISDAKRFNFGLYPRGTVRRLVFDTSGVVAVLCNVHLVMSGYVVVVKNSFFAKTDSDGNYRIVGVPSGQHRLRIWHERFPEQEHVLEVPEAGSVTLNFLVGEPWSYPEIGTGDQLEVLGAGSIATPSNHYTRIGSWKPSAGREKMRN